MSRRPYALMPSATGESLADTPAELFVVATHHTFRAAVYEGPGLFLRCRCAGGHNAFRVSIRELENAVSELLYLALSLARFGVLIRVVRAMRPGSAANRRGRGRCTCRSELADVGDQTGRATNVADELRICIRHE